eukprot:1398984-Alexandrium_andersonii.AAC.1
MLAHQRLRSPAEPHPRASLFVVKFQISARVRAEKVGCELWGVSLKPVSLAWRGGRLAQA